MQGRIGAGQLDHPVSPGPTGMRADGQGKIICAGHERGGPERAGQLEPIRHGVDGQHVAALTDQQLGGQQPDDALTENGDGLPDPGVGIEDRVQGHRTHPIEGADPAVEVGRHDVTDEPLGGQHRV